MTGISVAKEFYTLEILKQFYGEICKLNNGVIFEVYRWNDIYQKMGIFKGYGSLLKKYGQWEDYVIVSTIDTNKIILPNYEQTKQHSSPWIYSDEDNQDYAAIRVTSLKLTSEFSIRVHYLKKV